MQHVYVLWSVHLGNRVRYIAERRGREGMIEYGTDQISNVGHRPRSARIDAALGGQKYGI